MRTLRINSMAHHPSPHMSVLPSPITPSHRTIRCSYPDEMRLLLRFFIWFRIAGAFGFSPVQMPHPSRRRIGNDARGCLQLHPRGFGTASRAKPKKTKAPSQPHPEEATTTVFEYTPPTHKITHASLDFDIQSASHVVVTTNLTVTVLAENSKLVLDGDASSIKLRQVVLWKTSGENLLAQPQILQVGKDYTVTDKSLILEPHVGVTSNSTLSALSSFQIQTVVDLIPGKTDLSGLYFREGMLCTHCEPRGFSQITYYLDRPDNTAVFDVRVEASQADFPLLLSNGKAVATGNCQNDETRHYAIYRDPHPKPCYIFGLVAAKHLQVCAQGTHTTTTGRHVNITIYSEPTASSRMEFALTTLQQAMAWDEATYGISYDLDDYIVVAAQHYSIGAMENRGLNLFQTSLIATHPDSTTDVTYDLVAKTVAHEYFHNAFGNRVTVQSWREFGLKEGLTVFRDQEFTADIGLRTTVRIEAVKILREKQFREDASPTIRHAVRPDQVTVTLDSLASSTTYHKGAEVCRVFQTVLGKGGFRKGLRRYLNRHDGTGATWDDFRNAMADANSVNLDQLGLWYSTAGTPTLRYNYTYDEDHERLSLTFTQHLACNPEVALHIPIAVGLLDKVTGREVLSTTVLELRSRSATFTFDDVPKQVVPSILRDFSAPVILVSEDVVQHENDLSFLAAYDTDGYNRWEAFQNLYAKCIYNIMRSESLPAMEDSLFNAFDQVLKDTNIDDATKSYLLDLPTESVLSRGLEREDPAGIHQARKTLGRMLRSRFKADIEELYGELTNKMPLGTSLTTESRAARSLRNVLLDYLCCIDESSDDILEAAACAMQHFDSATCLTDRLASFRKLVSMAGKASPVREEAIEKFYQYAKANDSVVVMNKWFQTQALSNDADVLNRVQRLTQHPDFKATNAGRFRSLVTSFTMNANAFHTEEGYKFAGSVISQMDRVAPALSVELANKLATWRRHSPERASLMKAELKRIGEAKKISPSLSRAVQQALAD